MDNTLFTVPRYIPKIESSINEVSLINEERENKNVINNKISQIDQEDRTHQINGKSALNNNEMIEKKINTLEKIQFEKLEINEKIWFSNLIKKKDENFEIANANAEASESDEEIIINTDNIFKNIYPFFKTEKDPNYLKQKKELKKSIKNMS